MSNFFAVLDDVNEDGVSRKAAAKAAAPAKPKPAAPKPAAAKPAAAAAAAPAQKAKPVVLPPSKLENNKPPRQQRKDAHTGMSERRQRPAGAEGDAPRRRREFDRHSGTGKDAGPVRGKSVPKGGAGKGNWGSVEEEMKEATEKLHEETAPAHPNENGGAVNAEKKTDEAAAAAPAPAEKKIEEEPDNSVTMKEYLKKNKAKPLALPSAPRKVETTDDKSFTVVKRSDDVFIVKKEETKPAAAAPAKAAAAAAKGKDAKKEEAAAKPVEKVVPVNQVLNVKIGGEDRDRAPRGGRGGARGGARGGSPRGGARGGAPRGGARAGSEPQFNDSAFPSLTKA